MDRFTLNFCLVGVLCLAGCAAPAEAPPPAAPEAMALIGATLVTGDGGDLTDAGLLIKDGLIVQIGPSSKIELSPTTTVIDFTGKFIMPGLVDVHCHYPGDRAEVERLLRNQLYFGVLTARSAGGDSAETLAVLRDAQAGRIPGPRVYSAGLGFSAPQGHPLAYTHIYRPTSPEEARRQVDELANWQVAFVKMWVDDKYGRAPKLEPAVRSAIVEEAIQRGMRPMAHIFAESDVRQLIDVGVRDFLHTVRDPMDVSDEFLALCKKLGVSFAPTLSVIESNWRLAENPQLLSQDPDLAETLAQQVIASVLDEEQSATARANADIPMLKEELEVAQRFTVAAAEAGVRITVGSDSGTERVPSGWGTHRELELLSDAGLASKALVIAATSAGAGLMPERGAPFGRLAEGYAADLLVLTSDPRDSIRSTRHIQRIMQAGRWIDRQRLAPEGD